MVIDIHRTAYSRKSLLLFLAITFSVFLFPAPKAKAFVDPVTIALLTPVAIYVAKKASPYIIRGLMNAGRGLIRAGKDLIDVFRLPLGFLQVTLGAPFGFLGSGLRNIVKGGIAPFMLTYHMLMVPIMAFGVNVNY